MADRQLCARLDNSKVTVNDILQVQEFCIKNIMEEVTYNLRNDAKIRAVTTTNSYEEFKAIVDAAHLKSLSREDKQNSKTSKSRWNSIANK